MTRVCSHCGSENGHVTETRLGPLLPFPDNVVRRRRRCRECGTCWWTIEIPFEVAVRLAAKATRDDLIEPKKTFRLPKDPIASDDDEEDRDAEFDDA